MAPTLGGCRQVVLLRLESHGLLLGRRRPGEGRRPGGWKLAGAGPDRQAGRVVLVAPAAAATVAQPRASSTEATPHRPVGVARQGEARAETRPTSSHRTHSPGSSRIASWRALPPLGVDRSRAAAIAACCLGATSADRPRATSESQSLTDASTEARQSAQSQASDGAKRAKPAPAALGHTRPTRHLASGAVAGSSSGPWAQTRRPGPIASWHGSLLPGSSIHPSNNPSVRQSVSPSVHRSIHGRSMGAG